jgi:hypothetical protein
MRMRMLTKINVGIVIWIMFCLCFEVKANNHIMSYIENFNATMTQIKGKHIYLNETIIMSTIINKDELNRTISTLINNSRHYDRIIIDKF